MSPDATDDQIKNDLITGYSDLQGPSCKQAAYDNISQQPDEPLRSYMSCHHSLGATGATLNTRNASS